MRNQDFCAFLEYKISDGLKISDNEQLKGFWCDGVLLPNNSNEYSQKIVNNRRQIIMTAFIGKTGQDKYELILRFGKESLSKYARDSEIIECIPKPEKNDWLNVDVINKQVTIQLN